VLIVPHQSRLLAPSVSKPRNMLRPCRRTRMSGSNCLTAGVKTQLLPLVQLLGSKCQDPTAIACNNCLTVLVKTQRSFCLSLLLDCKCQDPARAFPRSKCLPVFRTKESTKKTWEPPGRTRWVSITFPPPANGENVMFPSSGKFAR